MNFFTELQNRWKLESPKFHVKLQNFGLWLVATGIALIGLPAGLEELGIQQFNLSLLGSIASYMVLTGSVIKVVAGTAVKNPDYKTLDKKE